MTNVTQLNVDDLKFDANGLIAAIAQDHKDGTILMLAYMNKESLQRTFQEGEVVYWSRSRQKYWKKGEESGNVQKLKGIFKDREGRIKLLMIAFQR